MAVLTLNPITMVGTKPTFVPCNAGGDQAATGFGYVLIFKNTSGAPITVTIAVPGTLPNGVAYPDTPYVVAATTGEAWVPVPDLYQDPTTFNAMITYTGVTNLTVALVRMM